jgi:hypothetical protein
MRSEITRDGPRAARRAFGLVAALALAAAGVAGCKSEGEAGTQKPGTAEVSKTVTEKASVVSVDKQNRLVTLKAKDGQTTTVQCGPEVRNFDQISAGDSVVVRYLVSLAVALVKPGETPPAAATLAAGRAEKGEKPGAAVGGQITATVKIESVDLKKNLVVFTAPNGGLRAVNVEKPEGVKFIQGIKPGDLVQITYTEALAVSVEKDAAPPAKDEKKETDKKK